MGKASIQSAGKDRRETAKYRLDKTAVNLWLVNSDSSIYDFEDVQGNQFACPVECIVKHEDCYHVNMGRRGLRIARCPAAFRLVNARIDKDGHVHPRRETQKYHEDIELWNKIKRYNSKARMLRIGQLNIINDKVVYTATPETTEIKIPPIVSTLPVLAKQPYARGVEKITIQSNATSIPDNFAMFGRLKEIKMNNSLTSIGSKAFTYCEQLEEIDIPKNVKRIGNEAFSNCDKLRVVRFNGPLMFLGSGAFVACESLEEIVLPNGLGSILDNTFYYCRNLKKVFIPKSVQGVATSAFGYVNPKLVITAPEHLRPSLDRTLGRNYKINYYPG